jgi:O-Antigen ligase
MFYADRRMAGDLQGSHGLTARRLALVAVGLALLFAAQFGLNRVMTRFQTDPLEDLRIPLTIVTFETALENLPFGTGFGSFVPVYASKERTEDLLSSYANRAHDDWAEFLLETGIPGVLVALLFLWWLGAKAVAIWKRRPADALDHHLALQRGATLVIALLLAHSAVDYPLRTTAMATLFAFACAILIDPREPEIPAAAPPRRSTKGKAVKLAAPKEVWGADIGWPEAWRNRRL